MKAHVRPNAVAVVEAIQRVVGHSSIENPISLHEPDFSGTQAWTYVKDCLDTGWVSTAGSWVSRFEKKLCSITGAEHAVVVSSGTNALRLALHLVGVGHGDEVLLPPLSFVATANAIAHLGAVPHFVDVEKGALGMCPSALATRLDAVAKQSKGKIFNKETGRRIAAVVAVHVFGHPAEVNQLKVLADLWNLPLVEDAAEALASWRDDTHCGLFGTVGTLSFNGNKLITTGGGGALITNNHALAERARHLSTTAKLPHSWDFYHDAVGWNDRLPNLNAALGLAQLENLDRRLVAKRNVAQRYEEALSNLVDVELVREPNGCRSNHWLVSLRFTAEDPHIAQSGRLKLLELAHSSGLLLRPIWTPLHNLPMYISCPAGCLAISENEAKRLVNLPSSPQLIEGWAS
jgi:perosamine synthetase